MSDDPQTENAKVNDLSQKRALKDEAEGLLEPSGVFMAAVRTLRIGWYREWLDAKDQAVVADLRARLQALDAIPQMIKAAISDYKFAADRQRKHG